MKRIVIFILGCIALSACKKDNFARLKNDVTGTWEYAGFSGYPFIAVSFPPGNGKIIVIGRDGGSFERSNHDTVTFKGNYILEQKKDCFGSEKYIFLNTTDPSFAGNNRVISIHNDSLFLSAPNCLADGGTSIYRRQ